MPMSSRQREGNQRTSRGAEDEYVVFLQGIPPQCRWQELKDLVRQTALHIRQAVVYDDCHGHPTGLGQIIVKNEDEAWRTYDRLSTNGWNGHSLTVTLSLASAPTKPIAGPTKSPVTRIPYVAGYSSPPRGATSMSTPTSPPAHDISTTPLYAQQPDYAHLLTRITATALPQYVSIPSEPLSYQLPLIFPCDGTIPFHQTATLGQSFEPSSLATYRYSTSTGIRSLHGIPSNDVSSHEGSSDNPTDSDAQLQTPRSVFIQNLSYDTTWQNLKDHLCTAGTVERCDIPEDRKSGRRWKSYAVVTFRTKEEAKRAVALFDKSRFKGAKIRVRFGEETHGGVPGASMGYDEECDANGSGSGTRSTAVGRPKSGGVMTGKEAANNIASGGKKIDNCEPLVVNGSRVGLKAGRSTEDRSNQEDDICQRTREIRL